MSIIDESGSTWVTAFNDQAEKLLGGVTAKELFEMRRTDNTAAYDKVFADCLFKPFIAKVSILCSRLCLFHAFRFRYLNFCDFYSCC